MLRLNALTTIVTTITLGGVLMASCGRTDEQESSARSGPFPTGKGVAENGDTQSTDKKIEDLEKRMAALLGTQEQLQQMVTSDFASCQSTGENADPLINKICKVAQASTIEMRVQLKSELSSTNSALQDKVQALNDNLSRIQNISASQQDAINQQIAALAVKLQDLVASLAVLQNRMTNAEGAIAALQTLTASIQGVLKSSMQEVEIGRENLASGPLYESLLRRADKTKVVAYVDAYGDNLSLPNNPVQTTKGSSDIAVSYVGHGFAVGNTVKFSDLREGAGLTSGDLIGEFLVTAVPDANRFMVKVRRAATSSDSIGGTLGVAQKVIGRGMANIWSTGNGDDRAVRVTTLGTSRYNFVIKANGDICYSKGNGAASYAEIFAAGADIMCK